MTTPIDATLSGSPQAPVPVEVAEGKIEGAGPLDMRKAINYSVANLGASVFYALFNFGMPLYLETYKLPASLIGLLANERSFVGAFFQPLVGRLSDRTRTPLGRRRPFFIVGIPLVCGGLIWLATHPPLWEMIGVMAVLAFFLAVAWDPYMAMMADLFPPLQRGRIGGLLGLGAALGSIIFALLAKTLWEHNEFLIFMLVAGALLVTWTYTFFTVKEPPIDESAEQAPKAAKTNPIDYLKSLRQYPEVGKYVFAVLFFWMGTGGVIPFITLFGEKALHASQNDTFILPLAATLANGLFAIPLGILADRTSKKGVMIGGMVVFGVVGLIGSQSQNLLQGSIALAIAGGANAAMAQINPMLSDLSPRRRMAEFIGLGSAVFSFAQPLGSVVAGLVHDIAVPFVGDNDAYRWTFLTAGVMILISALLLTTVHPERAVTEE
ncbi:MAG: MFS transporter [Chloroflexia bacterium]